MKSVMEHSFSNVPSVAIQRSSFNRSFGLKTTFDADYLIPVLVDDVIPGDTYNVNMNFFARLATPLHPIMDNMYLESFFFFVPYRIIWDNWKKMHGEQDDPGDNLDFTVPVADNTGVFVGTGDLGDYMGLPKGLGFNASPDISALPARAYHMIWNDWFRDENLQDKFVWNTGNGPDASAVHEYDEVPLKRGKRHDYFTSALPWPQKGDAISLPLGTTAPIFTNSVDSANIIVGEGIGSALPVTQTLLGSAGAFLINSPTEEAGTYPDDVNYFADLSGATAATINDLRLAFQTQKLLERDARGGTRYNELILAHFGVTVPDFRLQRPEFLGGGSSPININPVANTTSVDSANDPSGADRFTGQLSAFGTVSGSHGFTKSFVEHGVIIGLVNVRADLTYSQGIERYWNKSTRYDFFYPVLAQIGEQSVLNKEIWSDGTANDELVFGYQERYAEYRYKPSQLTGLFRVDATSSLSAWHLSEDFTALPTLGATFITSNLGVPLDRAIAITSEPHFIFDSFFSMKCARPMPMFGVPGNLDRF